MIESIKKTSTEPRKGPRAIILSGPPVPASAINYRIAYDTNARRQHPLPTAPPHLPAIPDAWADSLAAGRLGHDWDEGGAYDHLDLALDAGPDDP